MQPYYSTLTARYPGFLKATAVPSNRTMVQPVHHVHPSRKLFFLVHGYTGSPTDFNELPEHLHRQHEANVKLPLLRGHGTVIQDLDPLGFADIFGPVEEEFRKDLAEYDEVYVGGVSFGAMVALILAARYPVRGVFNVCIPYRLNFPCNLPLMGLLGWYRKYWRKKISEGELQYRRQAFYYDAMHANGIRIIRDARRTLRPLLPGITCPVLTLFSRSDPLGNHRAARALDRVAAPHQRTRIFSDGPHNLFFSETRHEIYREISSFFAPTAATAAEARPKVAAIVPAYNEAANISRVLQVLNATPGLDEIIVVDDGSTDGTSEAARGFPRVTLLRNDPNLGKAQSMQRGVSATDADIFFFCDADLHGLTPEAVAQIVRPVAEGRFDMFIGIRNNRMQKAVQLFAVNSGERAVSRSLWEKLPAHFKYRYRVEAGLNHVAHQSGRGYGWRQLDYYQTLKEKKYGFIRGTALRWWMNLDVGYAYLLAIIGRFFSDGPHTPA